MYNPKKIESKWEKEWKSKKLYQAKSTPDKKKKKYILPQLPYPSGYGLHVGHAEGYTACDIYARYNRMIGKDVMQAIGWDAFGLPAENYAIKTNIHPKISINDAVENFRYQLGRMGCSLDWDREVGSHNPDYYKWTQWFFLLMYNQGLVYRDKQMTNWCSKCKTVLANDQVKDGNCERCDTLVEQKAIDVWYIKITDYADRLYEDLPALDWPAESIKRQQDWIGKSAGAKVRFAIDGLEKGVEVFTTRIDTIYGCTFLVLSPELLDKRADIMSKASNKDALAKYIKHAKSKSSLERTVNKEKKGVLINGVQAVNPVNNEKIPVFVADYVLTDYGTGAVMGVPAHDERDNEFARNYKIPIIKVISPIEIRADLADKLYTGDGKMINSGEYNGMDNKEFTQKILEKFEKQGIATKETMFKLHDWSVSRQRFWGAPVPMMIKPLTEDQKKLSKIYANKPDKLVQLHAWGSSPTESYHPWIQSRFEDTKTPVLPNPDVPVFEEWLKSVKEAVGEDSSNTVLTSRSLSSVTALKLAEGQKFRKLILVCPVSPFTYLSDLEKKDKETLENFISNIKNIDFSSVAKNVGEIVFYLSTNDPYIPLEQTEKWIKEKFPFARIVRFREMGHFEIDEFPKLLEEINAPVQLELVRAMDDDLPVKLPDDVDFMPTGKSPLTYSNEFQKGVEEKYGKGWKREVDTLDTFMCSSWYYMRYLDPKNDKQFASKEVLDKWMPVDFYIGGPEHVTGHLLYSRFFTKVLYDAGYIDSEEPFLYHRHQGLILGEDGRKMSKRWGNVINPTDVMDRHGADTLRLYEMFMGPLEDSKAWSVKGETGVFRFLNKVWTLQDKVNEDFESEEQKILADKLLNYIAPAISDLRFNTCVSKFMEFVNFMGGQEKIDRKVWEQFLLVFAPFAPFIAEELWSKLGHDDSIHLQDWPTGFGTNECIKQIEIPVQINGKVRGRVIVDVEATDDDVNLVVLSDAGLKKYFDGGKVRSMRFVKGKIVSYEI